MSAHVILVETILAGFFAVACIRACVPDTPGDKLSFSNLLRLPGRIERLRRSRWQSFSMVALLLVIRLQMGLLFVLELIVAFQFLIFLALPTKSQPTDGPRRKGNAAAVGRSSSIPCLAAFCGKPRKSSRRSRKDNRFRPRSQVQALNASEAGRQDQLLGLFPCFL
jgi:hypothetical protein